MLGHCSNGKLAAAQPFATSLISEKYFQENPSWLNSRNDFTAYAVFVTVVAACCWSYEMENSFG